MSTEPEQFTWDDLEPDDFHRETLELLQEVLAYLENLPRVPVTTEFIMKTRARLDHPVCREIVERKFRRRGQAVDYSGRIIVDALLQNDLLTLQFPNPVPQTLYKEDGLKVTLRVED